jgi:hypothetical protein
MSKTWRIYNIRSYPYLVYKDDGRRMCDILNVMEPDILPYPAKNTEEWLEIAKRDKKSIPIGWFTAAEEDAAKDPTFFQTGFRYSKLPIVDLVQTFERLKPEHRNLCAVVVPGRRLHLFFDLDGEHDIYGKPFLHSKVRPAFERVLRRKFKIDFARDMDDTDTQWFISPKKNAYSAHYHVLSESFVDVDHFQRWIKRSWTPFVVEQAQAGDIDCIAILKVNMQSNWREEKFGSLVDEGNYSKHHMFRMGGNCKPCRPPFEVDPQDDRPLTTVEMLFRSSFCYALTGDAAKALTWRAPGSAADLDAEFAATDKSSCTRAASNSSDIDNKFEGDADADYSWMKRVRIPWFDEMNLPQPQVEEQKKTKSGVPIVVYRAGQSACISCTIRTGGGAIKKHKSNHSYLRISLDCKELHFTSTDSDCSRDSYEIPLTPELAKQLRLARAGGRFGQLARALGGDPLKEPDVKLAQPSSSVDTPMEDVVSSKKRKRDEEEPIGPTATTLECNPGWMMWLSLAKRAKVAHIR